MACRTSPRKVTYFEPVLPRLARNTIIESTFEGGRRFRCTMRIDCGQLDLGAVIRPEPGEWHAHARAPRRGGAGGLARRPQRGLSARRPDHRRAPRGRRRISRTCGKENPGGGGRGFQGGSPRAEVVFLNQNLAVRSAAVLRGFHAYFLGALAPRLLDLVDEGARSSAAGQTQ